MKKNALILLITLFWTNIFAQNADINILKDINLNRNKSLDGTFMGISDSVLPISGLLPIGTIAYAFIKKDSASKNNAILITSSFLVSGFLSLATKRLIKRDRPFVTYPYIENVVLEESSSFPSGHTSVAFATATSLSIAFPKWYVIAPSFIWASAVGYSRLDLGVHYPSDVLAGAILGSGSAYLSYKLNKWINKKYTSKKHHSSI